MTKKVQMAIEGYHKVLVGTDLNRPTIVIWFEHKNKVVDSDIKTKTYAIALGEHLQEKLQEYVDLQ